MRPDIPNNWMLHHDNAQCHTALSVTEFWTSKSIPVVPQPPCDFFLFHKLKNVLNGRNFRTLENIQKSVMNMLKTILVEEQRLHRCVAAQEEGDKTNV